MEPITVVKKVTVQQDKEVPAWRTVDGEVFPNAEDAQKHEEAYFAREEFFKLAIAVNAFKVIPAMELGVEFYIANLKTEKELKIIHNFLKTNYEVDEWTNLMSYLRQKVLMTIGKSIVDGQYIVTLNIIDDVNAILNKCIQILTNF